MEDRKMIYPYTFTAKMLNFPYKHYYNKNLLFRYYLYSLVICFPLFWKIQKLTYSEANVIKHQEYIKKEREEIKHHLDHLP